MSNKHRFEKLFEPARIGQITIRNRIVMPAMGTHTKPEGRHGTDRHKAYYEARAKGGVGLVIIEATTIDYRIGRIRDEQLAIDDDRYIPGLSELAEAIKRHGARAALQLAHAGSATSSRIIGVQPVGPSAIARPGYEVPRALTVDEIADLVARFAKGAERAKKAGFDGVEISSCHRFLGVQFLSPAFNKRQDDYGGNLRNRARFLLEIIEAIKDQVGTDFPVWCRLSAKEYGIEGGITLEDTQQMAVMAQEAGADAIHVTATPGLMPFHANDITASAVPILGPGCFIDLAASVKKVVGIPVIAVGRLTPQLGEKVLREQKADLIAMGRPLIADPELPNKVALGKLDDIVPCVYCNRCMDTFLTRDCTVNAAKGREREFEITPAERGKKVLIVGGGPAGMEAARVAALRGHEVILYEKDHRLGGQLVLAGLLRHEYENLTKYLATQIRKLGVKVKLGKRVSPELVHSLKPDAVIVAIGPKPLIPSIPGTELNNVLTAAGVQHIANSRHKLSSWVRGARWRRTLLYLGFVLFKRPGTASLAKWLLGFGAPFGRRVVIIGGGLSGLEMADFLVGKSKKVTIVETRESVAGGLRPMYLLMQYLLNKLASKGVSMLTSVKYQEITESGIVIISSDGERRLIEADTVVLTGAQANVEFTEALKDKVPEIQLVGDCVEPCGICEAIGDASRVARMV